MPQYGTVKRAKPRLRVLRGFDPNEPRTLTSAYAVFSDVTILSGQVIYPYWNSSNARHEWKLGCIAGKVPHIALQDSTDADVIEADSLVGLNCSGQFELQTGYYATAAVGYTEGTPLTYDGTTGNVLDTTLESGAPILGFVSRNNAAENLGPGISSTPYTYTGVPGKDSSATTLTVLTFTTTFLPNTADAT